MKTITYGVREFQAHLGDALRFVSSGARVVVTSHGTPVAFVSKPDAGLPKSSALEQKLERMAAAGHLVQRGGERIRPFKAPAVGGLSEQLMKDRR
jgi:antitoxin (DNA-binding transcriptional repressor) of toxin-antitoxin stability system